jgi:beta-xylosidase
MAGGQVWQSDRGDGTYANPPLYADYPIPTSSGSGAISYFITTTFANVPGLDDRDLAPIWRTGASSAMSSTGWRACRL